jgi:cyclopropane fatty-acyl-phospholipid synthase-like methyltransferase
VEDAVGDPSRFYREFPFPLNALLLVLLREEGRVEAMHYGLFEREGEPIGAAQERSTALLLSRLPAPPCRLLEVGIGLGTMLGRLLSLGYQAEGITPDARQMAVARSRFGDRFPAHAVGLEGFRTEARYDAIVFQESSQYIDSATLARRARELAAPGAVLVVLDEFALGEVRKADALPRLDRFLACAAGEGFRLEEQLDLSRQAAPTVDYFLSRIPSHRAEIEAELGVGPAELDALLTSGAAYRELYRTGEYGYRLLVLKGRSDA